MSVSWSPRKTERMAGGASFAPRRWSFPALATGDPEEVLVPVHRLDHGRAEEQEEQVLVGGVAGVEEVHPVSVARE
jgi:hypothetical protein